MPMNNFFNMPRKSKRLQPISAELLEVRALLAAPIDESEPNDNSSQSDDLGTFNDNGTITFRGTIGSSSTDFDWFKFTLGAGANVTLIDNLGTSGGISTLNVYKVNSGLLTNIILIDSPNVKGFSQPLAAGTYYIQLRQNPGSASTTYNFDLTASDFGVDQYESNNTLETATNLGALTSASSLNGNIQGQVGFSGDTDDYFKFTIGNGLIGAGTLNLTGLSSNAVLEVFGKDLFAASNNPLNSNESITFNNLEAGTYAIHVKTFGAGSAYNLSYTIATAAAPTADGFESNNTQATASFVGSLGNTGTSVAAISRTFNGNLGYQGDTLDHFFFTVDPLFNASGTITLTGLSANLNLEVFGPNGVFVSSVNAGNANETIILPVLDPGNYQIRISQGALNGQFQVQKSAYSLNVNLTATKAPDADIYENNDTLNTAFNLGTVGSAGNSHLIKSLNGNVGFLGDKKDFFQFTVATGQTASGNLILSGLSDDLELVITGPGGFIMTSSLAGNVNENINLNNLAAGQYAIQVRPPAGKPLARSSYNLLVNLVSTQDNLETNNFLGTATDLGNLTNVLAINQTISGNIGLSGDVVDFYKFTIPSGDFGSGTVKLKNLGFNAKLTIRNATQSFLITSDNAGNTDELLTLNSIPAGVYYIAVEPAVGGITGYELEINLTAATSINAEASESNDSPATAEALGNMSASPFVQSRNGNVGVNGDTEDNFKFGINAGVTANGTLRIGALTGSITVEVFGPGNFFQAVVIPADTINIIPLSLASNASFRQYNIRIKPTVPGTQALYSFNLVF